MNNDKIIKQDIMQSLTGIKNKRENDESLTKFIEILKRRKQQLLKDKIKLQYLDPSSKEVNEVIKNAIRYDNQQYCYGFEYIDQMIEYLKDYCLNYMVMFDTENIGHTTIGCAHRKDITRFMISIVLKEEFRGCGIGYQVIEQLLDICFSYDVCKSIVATIVDENYASQNLFIKSGFSLYRGYRELDYFEVQGEKYKQSQYMLKKKDYNLAR